MSNFELDIEKLTKALNFSLSEILNGLQWVYNYFVAFISSWTCLKWSS